MTSWNEVTNWNYHLMTWCCCADWSLLDFIHSLFFFFFLVCSPRIFDTSNINGCNFFKNENRIGIFKIDFNKNAHGNMPRIKIITLDWPGFDPIGLEFGVSLARENTMVLVTSEKTKELVSSKHLFLVCGGDKLGITPPPEKNKKAG